MHRRTTRLLLAALLVLGGGCASRGPLYDQLDADQLYRLGMDQMERRRWGEAETAFQRLLLQFPGDPRSQEVRFRVAETYFGRGEYVTAALEFDRLAGDQPSSPWADDARFNVCRAYERLAPGPRLDQQYTQSAIDHCSALIAYYPDSEFAGEAREIIIRLTSRLAEKEYLTGEDYRRRRAFDSAILSYDRVVAEYPATPWAARSLLRLYEVYVALEYEPEAEATRSRLLRDYPNTPEARQVGGSADDS